MEKIGLLLDSTSLTRDNIKSYPFIKTVDLNVIIDDQSFTESELSKKTIQEYLYTAKKLSTSQPAPGDFLNCFEAFKNEGYTHVLVILISEKISGTYQTAMIAKSLFDKEMEISIHSPKVASYGVINGVMPLIKMIAQGETFDNVLAKYYRLFEDAKVMFTLSNLMHLFKGGRLSRIQALIGTVLRIKPIIEMIDGKLQVTKKVRTNNACFDYFLDTINQYNEKYNTVYLDIIHLNKPEWAEKIKEEVIKKYPKVIFHITEYVSPVFYVHLGNQGFGIALAGE